MWIKICANTNRDDALAAADLGADAVGFVFAPSKRQVVAQLVAEITPHLPPGVERVGVFTTEDLDSIAHAVEQAGLTTVQLHGGVNLPFAHQLQQRLGPAISIIETTHWLVTDDAAAQPKVAAALTAIAADPHGHRLLIDAKVGSASGGLGIAFDWSNAQQTLALEPRVRVIVAGGLRPDNVADAIRKLRPWGVDVASGVEQEPGKKSYEKLRQFIAAVRESETA
jgi:phosphoribosylanthranilate isomerase